MKWKSLGCIGLVSLSFIMVPSIYAKIKKEEHGALYKTIQATQDLSWLPDDYQEIDWKKRASSFNELLFNNEEYDFMFFEPGLNNTAETMLGMVTHVTDERTMSSSEAITVITALLSASQLDENLLDTNTLTGLAKKVEAYYNTNHGEHAFLNRYDARSRDHSFWQQIYPGLLYFMLMDRIEPTENSDELLKQIAESWYDVVMDLGGKSHAVDFAYTGYDFKDKEPYDNGEWVETDAAAGIALIEYYAFLKFGERKYMQAALLCMDYLDEFDHHPGHRLLYFYLPYLSARLNSQEHTRYDTAKFMEYFFTETFYQNNWGWFQGLVGNSTEYGGTAYCYESLMAVNALVPMLKYDQRYAKEMGRYLLHLTQNLNVFFEDDQVIPLSQSKNGEPSILGGTPLGLFASSVNRTNVEGILSIDLNVNEYYDERQDKHASFLLFNPHPQLERVQYQVQSDKTVGLYDLVRQDFLVLNVQNETQLEVPAKEAVIILEIELEEGDNSYKIDRKVEKNVTAAMKAGVNISNFKDQQVVEGEVPVELEIMLREVGISTIAIFVDQEEVFKNVTYEEPYLLDGSELTAGYHVLEVELADSRGEKDYAYARFFVTKGEEIKIVEEDFQVINSKNSSVFEVDFSQNPLLELMIAEIKEPWSLGLKDQASGELFTLIKNSEDSGTIKINLNQKLAQLNKEKFDLSGSHQVQLCFNGSLTVTEIRLFNEGIVSLSEKEWKTPFTPQKMTHWKSRLSGDGKLNFYNGKAWVKNLNESASGAGKVKTDYFAVDLTKDAVFKISVEEVDELWSLLVYLEGQSQAHFLQYPTDQTGVFTYHISEKLRNLYPDKDLNELMNVQFWLVSNGDYEAVTRIDYLSLEYNHNWIQLASIGFLGIFSVSAIFVNLNRDL